MLNGNFVGKLFIFSTFGVGIVVAGAADGVVVVVVAGGVGGAERKLSIKLQRRQFTGRNVQCILSIAAYSFVSCLSKNGK